MIHKTSHPQIRVIVWPLYLPQIYWVIISNSHVESIQDVIRKGLLTEWEAQFFSALGKLHFSIDRPSTGFWSEKFNKSVLKNGPFRTKAGIKDFLIANSNEGPLAMNNATGGRIDQKITYPAEALGLINLPFNDKSPTDFFHSLMPPNSSGKKAVASILAKLVSLNEPTIESVTTPPRQMILDHLTGIHDRQRYLDANLPGQHPNAGYTTYVDSVREWFELEPSSAHGKEILNLINAIPSRESSMTEDWRNEIPDLTHLRPILPLIGESENVISNNPIATESKSMDGKTNNIILVGPPGTGKSKMASLLALELLQHGIISESKIKELEQNPSRSVKTADHSGNIFWTQLHQSYSYEDFVEGIRPVSNLNDISTVRYAVAPGPFKAIAQLARAYWEKSHDGNRYMIPITAYVDADAKSVGIPREYALYNLENRAGHLYERLIDGTLVAIANTGGGQIELAVLPTQKKRYLELLWSPSQISVPNFVLVIDEINRGNTSKIFGELLSLIEPSKRLGENDNIHVSLAYSKESFSLPPNLHIVATMNQADRSLSVMDQAFRRRFKLIYLKPNFDLIRKEDLYKKATGKNLYDKKLNIPLAQHFENINKALKKCDVADSQHIGHSYAFQVADEVLSGHVSREDALAASWNAELHSLIREILPENAVMDFLQAFLELEKKNQSITIKDFESTFKESIPDYKAA